MLGGQSLGLALILPVTYTFDFYRGTGGAIALALGAALGCAIVGVLESLRFHLSDDDQDPEGMPSLTAIALFGSAILISAVMRLTTVGFAVLLAIVFAVGVVLGLVQR